MKRFLLYCVLISLIITAGCRRAEPVRVEGMITVSSLTFPSFDFARAIAGDRVNLNLLTSPGMESHSFEPGPRDIITIRESDIFIYPGGHGSAWMDRILDAADITGGRPRIMKLIDMAEALEEEFVEGMEVYHGHDHDSHDDHDHDHDEEVELDEHVWTSPRNAVLIVSALTDALSELDPANSSYYQQNAAAYINQLMELDAAFQAVVDGARRKTILVADRFPFRYLAYHYGLEYYAAFSGCSTETEPSAATVAFLINQTRSLGLPVVFHIELSTERIADTVSEATGARKLLLHSAHNLSMRDFNDGMTYLDILRNNLENLREALW